MVMSSSGLAMAESAHGGAVNEMVSSVRKRHSSCEDVLMGDLKACIASSSPSPSPSAWKGKERRACLCAPTTHAGSFKCRLHRSSASSSSLLRSASSPALPMKLLKGDRNVKRSSSVMNTIKSNSMKPSRLSKMLTSEEMESMQMLMTCSILAEDVVNKPLPTILGEEA